MKKSLYKKSAFGLLEVVMVIAIFILCLGGVISVTALSYRNLAKNEARWKAVTLGQNAIDLARNTRDNNILSDTTWTTGLVGAGTSVLKYYDQNMNDCGDMGAHCQPAGVITFRLTAYGVLYPSSDSIVYISQIEWEGPTITYKTILKDFKEYL